MVISAIVEVEALRGCESAMHTDASHLVSEGGVESVGGGAPGCS